MCTLDAGTGTPNTLPKQVATSYLIQLGSQRNILFDVGTGSITNLYATAVNMSTINLVSAFWVSLAVHL